MKGSSLKTRPLKRLCNVMKALLYFFCLYLAYVVSLQSSGSNYSENNCLDMEKESKCLQLVEEDSSNLQMT